MFVSQAHSFTQQARLAITLAWVAGYTNVITILALGSVTSHVSGTTSHLGEYAAQGNFAAAALALFLLVTFFLGAALSALTTELGRRKGWESVYVLPMAIEALLLAAFAVTLEFSDTKTLINSNWKLPMLGLASLAMGLQNATITRISSGVVRTTHVTGVLTDLGSEAVLFLWWLKDKRAALIKAGPAGAFTQLRTHAPGKRLLMLASIVGSFALGAGLGTFAFTSITRWSMIPPVLFLLWIIYQDVRSPIVEIEPSDLVTSHGLDLPPGIAVYHLRRDASRPGHLHALPDLQSWSERLPDSTRVIILDLGDVTALDANTAPELNALRTRLLTQKKRLIISGITPEHYDELRAASGEQGLDLNTLCTDLDLAIARGYNQLEELQSR
jgi:uncharacterized membrane protein YoaK (UPF0700 family)